MLKILSASLPLLDYLYIFQSFEYERWNFLKWSIGNISRRDLQKKKKLVWTGKAAVLFLITVCLVVSADLLVTLLLSSDLRIDVLLFLAIFYIFVNFAPIFLVAASMLLWPVEGWQKFRLIQTAIDKRNRLKNLAVVGITGSFAKTSTKEMLYTILRKDFRVAKTPKSYNTEIAIARSLISIKDNTEIFIAEMDAYHPGEIGRLAKIVRPTIGMITAIAPQHLERFGSIEKLASTQFEINSELIDNGLLVLNTNDEWSQKLSREMNRPIIWFGESEKATMRIEKVKMDLEGTAFDLVNENKSVKVRLPLLGKHHAVNFAAAASVAKMLGMTLEQIADRAKWILPTPHRLEIKKLGGMTIIDNSYNSNPTSYKASFELLSALGGEKIIITPGLVELGKSHYSENKQMGVLASKVANQVVIIGENAKKALLDGLTEGGLSSDKIHFFGDPKVAMEHIASFVASNAVILIENDLPDQYL